MEVSPRTRQRRTRPLMYFSLPYRAQTQLARSRLLVYAGNFARAIRMLAASSVAVPRVARPFDEFGEGACRGSVHGRAAHNVAAGVCGRAPAHRLSCEQLGRLTRASQRGSANEGTGGQSRAGPGLGRGDLPASARKCRSSDPQRYFFWIPWHVPPCLSPSLVLQLSRRKTTVGPAKSGRNHLHAIKACLLPEKKQRVRECLLEVLRLRGKRRAGCLQNGIDRWGASQKSPLWASSSGTRAA